MVEPKAHPKAQVPGLHLFLMDSGFRVSAEDEIVGIFVTLPEIGPYQAVT
jgi:hypothetical protein